MWSQDKLGKLCDISIGKTPSRKNLKYWDKNKSTKNIWLSIADLKSIKGKKIFDSKEYISDEGAKLFSEVPKNTLIMSFKLTIGRLAITGCNLRTNEAIASLKIKDKKIIDQEYLFYYLYSFDWDKISANDIKVKGKTLNKAKLKEVDVFFPSITEQKRIVSKLDNLFPSIEKSINIVQSKKEEIKNLKRASLSSILKTITQKKENLGDICNFVRGPFGGSLKKNIFVEKGFPVYEQKHAINNQCEEFRYFITKEKFDEMKRFAVKKNDILMSCSGTIGKTVIVPDDFQLGIINQALLKITPSKEIDVQYLKFYMESTLFDEQLMETVDGTAIQNVASVKILEKIKIILPSLKEQILVVTKLKKIFRDLEKINNNINKLINNYSSLKSVILSRMIQTEKIL